MAIHTKKSVSFFITVLTVAVVAIFVVSFATAAQAETFTVTGKVVSIDKSAKTLTIDPAYFRGAKSSAADLRTFSFYTVGSTAVSPERRSFGGQVWMGNEKRNFEDINLGDLVTINYHQESNGIVVADGININAPAAVTMRPEEKVIPGVTERAAPAFSLTGKVVSIDPDARSLAVNPIYEGKALTEPKEVRTFALDNTSLYRNGQSANLRDLNVGDLVTINYHQESNGRIVADSIAINPPITRYPEQGASGFSVTGRIVSLDKSAGTFALEPSTYTAEKFGGRSFYLDNGTTIMMGDRSVRLGDLHIGDQITVNFHQDSSGRIVADSISVIPGVTKYPQQGMMGSFSGKIVSIDKNAGTFVIQPSAYATERERTLSLGDASILMGNRTLTLNDLNIGDQVVVKYHEDDSGRIVADSVAITSPETAPFPEERG